MQELRRNMKTTINDMRFDPTLKQLADMNNDRRRFGLPELAEGEIKTAGDWWNACELLDEVAQNAEAANA